MEGQEEKGGLGRTKKTKETKKKIREDVPVSKPVLFSLGPGLGITRPPSSKRHRCAHLSMVLQGLHHHGGAVVRACGPPGGGGMRAHGRMRLGKGLGSGLRRCRGMGGSCLSARRALSSQFSLEGGSSAQERPDSSESKFYLIRTDGIVCSREEVGEDGLQFSHPSTQQLCIQWKVPPKKVLVLKKLGEELLPQMVEVCKFLHRDRGLSVLVERAVQREMKDVGIDFVDTWDMEAEEEAQRRTSRARVERVRELRGDTLEPEGGGTGDPQAVGDEGGGDDIDGHQLLASQVDFVVCLGGDGVILHASSLFGSSPTPPILSFNLGSLGFLTAHLFEEFEADIDSLMNGGGTDGLVYLTLRMRLECDILRDGESLLPKPVSVMNEVVVDRGSSPYLSLIECWDVSNPRRSNLVTRIQADGIMIATATGSTAYNCAAGGSMVHPNVPAILFTPICPHSVSFRPVILPDSAELQLRVPTTARSSAWVSFDGKQRKQITKGDSVRIKMSPFPIPTVNKVGQTDDWFDGLVRCLKWNERLTQGT